MHKTASTEALQVNVKSYELSNAIIKTDLFSKIGLKPVSRMILLTLSSMYNPKLGYSFPGEEKLAACTGYSIRQIKDGIKQLSVSSGLIMRTDKKIYFTKKFYELLDLKNFCNQNEESSLKNEISAQKYEVSSLNASGINTDIKYNTGRNFVPEQETKQIIKQNNNFSFKNLMDLSKTNTVLYSEEVSKLSESDKEHLCKIKLNRTSLTNFQKENLEKFIMLNDSEIQVINTKEPYYKQEKIDIYYNARMKKIREFQEKSKVDKFLVSPPPKDMFKTLFSERTKPVN